MLRRLGEFVNGKQRAQLSHETARKPSDVDRFTGSEVDDVLDGLGTCDGGVERVVAYAATAVRRGPETLDLVLSKIDESLAPDSPERNRCYYALAAAILEANDGALRLNAATRGHFESAAKTTPAPTKSLVEVVLSSELWLPSNSPAAAFRATIASSSETLHMRAKAALENWIKSGTDRPCFSAVLNELSMDGLGGPSISSLLGHALNGSVPQPATTLAIAHCFAADGEGRSDAGLHARATEALSQLESTDPSDGAHPTILGQLVDALIRLDRKDPGMRLALISTAICGVDRWISGCSDGLVELLEMLSGALRRSEIGVRQPLDAPESGMATRIRRVTTCWWFTAPASGAEGLAARLCAALGWKLDEDGEDMQIALQAKCAQWLELGGQPGAERPQNTYRGFLHALAPALDDATLKSLPLEAVGVLASAVRRQLLRTEISNDAEMESFGRRIADSRCGAKAPAVGERVEPGHLAQTKHEVEAFMARMERRRSVPVRLQRLVEQMQRAAARTAAGRPVVSTLE